LNTRIHTFDRRNRSSVERRFSDAGATATYDDICATQSDFQWIVIADDWLVVTGDNYVARNANELPGATFVNAAGSAPPTYDVPQTCP
jgi:hypothetical protein